MKIILATLHLEPSTRAVPLAAACLKAMVKEHNVILQNYYLHQTAELIGQSILKEKAEAVGFSVYLWNRSLVGKVIKILKERVPDVIILAGGPEVTAGPDAFLEDTQADILMQGEGEETISPILDAIEKGKEAPRQNGIRTRSYTPAGASFCPDFNSLPSPLLSGALDLSQNPGLLWELSRGCPFSCDFCFESKGSGRIRSISLDRVRKELELIRDYEIEQVFVLDPTFNANKKRVLDILSMIREYTPYTYYYFEIRSEFIDEETAEAFSTIPCTLQIGLQSGSPQVLKKVNRTLVPEQFRKKMEVLSRYAVSFGLDLIYGLPEDSLDGFRDSLNYALSLEPNHLDLFPLAVLPGTVLYDNAKELGLYALGQDPYHVIRTSHMSPAAMEKATILSEETDFLYNKGKAVGWFMNVCRDTAMEPVEIIEHWSLFRAKETIDEEHLQDPIIRFLQKLYQNTGKNDGFRIIRDFIRLLEIQDFMEEVEGTSETPAEAVLLDEDSQLVRHSSMLLQYFAVPPPILLQSSEIDTEGMVPYLEKEDTLWVFWSREWDLSYEKVDPLGAALLQSIKEPRRLGDLTVSEDRKQWLNDFILEGILEGYLILC